MVKEKEKVRIKLEPEIARELNAPRRYTKRISRRDIAELHEWRDILGTLLIILMAIVAFTVTHDAEVHRPIGSTLEHISASVRYHFDPSRQ